MPRTSSSSPNAAPPRFPRMCGRMPASWAVVFSTMLQLGMAVLVCSAGDGDGPVRSQFAYGTIESSASIAILGLWIIIACTGHCCYPNCIEATFDIPEEFLPANDQRSRVNKAVLCISEKQLMAHPSTFVSRFQFIVALLMLASIQFTHKAIVESVAKHGTCEPGFACFQADFTEYPNGKPSYFEGYPPANCTHLHGHPASGPDFLACYRMRGGTMAEFLDALGTSTGTVGLLWLTKTRLSRALVALRSPGLRFRVGIFLVAFSFVGFIGVLVGLSVGDVPNTNQEFLGIWAFAMLMIATGIDVLVGPEVREDIDGRADTLQGFGPETIRA